MLSKVTWIVPTALAVVFAMMFVATGLTVFVAPCGLALLCLGWALWRDFKPRSKYDLSLLRDIHEKEELAELDDSVGVIQYDDYLCPYCRTLFSTEHRNCPNCGRARSRV